MAKATDLFWGLSGHRPADWDGRAALRVVREAVAVNLPDTAALAHLSPIIYLDAIRRADEGFELRIDEAVAIAERATQYAMGKAHLLFPAAWVLAQVPRTRVKGIRIYRHALELTPHDSWATALLSNVLAQAGEWAEATDIAERQLVDQQNLDSYNYLTLVLAASHLGDWERAANMAMQQLDAFPGLLKFWMLLANALGQLGDHRGSEQAVTKAAAISRGFTPAHWRWLLRQEMTGDSERFCAGVTEPGEESLRKKSEF